MRFCAETFKNDLKNELGTTTKQAPDSKAFQEAVPRILGLLPRGTLVTVPESEATDYLVHVINAVRKASTFEKLADREQAKEAFDPENKNAFKKKAILAAADGVGRYLPKLENSKVSRYESMPVAFEPTETERVSSVFPTAFNTNAEMALSCSCNGRDAPIGKILMSRCQDENGEVRHLIERIAANDAIGAALANIVPTEIIDGIADTYRDKVESGLSDVQHVNGNGMNIVFVPDGEGGYMQVTPVPSVQQYTELGARIRETFRGGGKVPKRTLTVTSKSQSMATHAMYMGGRINKLSARFDLKPRSEFTRLYAILNGAPIFKAHQLRHSHALSRFTELATTMYAPDGEAYVNLDIRQGVRASIRGCLRHFLADIQPLQETAMASPRKTERVGQDAPAHIRDILLLRRRQPDAEETEAIVSEMTPALMTAARKAHSRFSSDRIAEDKVRYKVAEVARSVVQEEFA